MDVSVAHIVGAFTEAYRNRQRQKREENFRTAADAEPNERSSLKSTEGIKVPLRVVYQIRDYMLKLDVRHAEGSARVSSAMSYEQLLQMMREKAGMLGVTEGRWTIVALPVERKEGRSVVTRECWESVATALEVGGKFWGLQLDCRL